MVSAFRILFSVKLRIRLGYLVIHLSRAFLESNLNLLDVELAGETVLCGRNEMPLRPGRPPGPRDRTGHHRELPEALRLTVAQDKIYRWMDKWMDR